MKKILVLMFVVVFALALCSCSNAGGGAGGGDDLVGQTVVGAPDTGALDAGMVDEGTSDTGTTDSGTADEGIVDSGTSGDGSSGESSGSEVAEFIPSGDYYCYDRFSGEGISGFYIRVHSSNNSQVVFDYVTSAGTFTSLTANIDANGSAYMALTDTLELNITFYSSEIYVDELEGMGAMAYVFK